MKLNAKQQLFCKEYLIDLNATAAAIRAGYSEKTAYSIGFENLKKPEIEKRIAQLQEERSLRNQISSDFVIEGLKTIANDDIKNYLDIKILKSGRASVSLRRDINQIDTKNISVLQIGPGRQLKIRLYSRENALIQLGRHTGAFEDTLSIKSKLGTILTDLAEGEQINDAHLKRIAELIFNYHQNMNSSNG